TVATGRVDLIVLPEVDFDKEKFLAEVKKCMAEKGKCYIVTSEGAHFADGSYLAAGEAVNDGFGHAVLGGAAEALKRMILEAGIAPRAKVQDLSTAARSSNFAQSLVDVTEAFELGMSAHARSAKPGFTGHVVAVQREYVDGKYNAKFISGPAEDFANHVKHVPTEWILPDYQGLTKEFHDYITPLIQGEPTLIMDGAIPATIKPFNMR
ncbi:MAG: phosphofructokinase, partial [Longicatena sp.]